MGSLFAWLTTGALAWLLSTTSFTVVTGGGVLFAWLRPMPLAWDTGLSPSSPSSFAVATRGGGGGWGGCSSPG